MRPDSPRRVCYVSGTRAEFGLMRSTLAAIAAHPRLQLQLIITGMHLDRARGRSLDTIRREGWNVDAVIPWSRRDGSPAATALATGKTVSALATAFDKLSTDIVLVTGDRVEAFAAAAAGHISGRLVAHVHGGDRALGLVDDSLRHSITKLAHLHFPATPQSARRIQRMGEDRWRIVRSGSPGLDDVRRSAAPRSTLADEFPTLSPGRFALLVLHPQTSDPRSEQQFAISVLDAARGVGFGQIVIVYPNNDPGSDGIARCWDRLKSDQSLIIRRDLPRGVFLGLLRDAAVLAGNSSSGIIEAASFGTPVLDIGHRQQGRERGKNVVHSPDNPAAIRRELRRIWNGGNRIVIGEIILMGLAAPDGRSRRRWPRRILAAFFEN